MNSKLAIAATTLIAAFAVGATEYTTTTSLNADVNYDKLTIGLDIQFASTTNLLESVRCDSQTSPWDGTIPKEAIQVILR